MPEDRRHNQDLLLMASMSNFNRNSKLLHDATAAGPAGQQPSGCLVMEPASAKWHRSRKRFTRRSRGSKTSQPVGRSGVLPAPAGPLREHFRKGLRVRTDAKSKVIAVDDAAFSWFFVLAGHDRNIFPHVCLRHRCRATGRRAPTSQTLKWFSRKRRSMAAKSSCSPAVRGAASPGDPAPPFSNSSAGISSRKREGCSLSTSL